MLVKRAPDQLDQWSKGKPGNATRIIILSKELRTFVTQYSMTSGAELLPGLWFSVEPKSIERANLVWLKGLQFTVHRANDRLVLAMGLVDWRRRYHDDVIKWKYFPRYWPFMRGIHQSSVNSPHKWPVKRIFCVFFDLRLNKRLSK